MDSTFTALAASAFRHALTLGAGFLIAKGVITDTQGPELVGLGMTGLAYGWSWFQKTSVAKKLEGAK